MSARKIECTKTFEGNLKDLSKKHPDLSDAVDAALAGYAATGESSASSKIPRMKGSPVFKERLAFGNQGKRGAARIIYYCDSELVVPMFPVHEERAGRAREEDSGCPEIGRFDLTLIHRRLI